MPNQATHDLISFRRKRWDLLPIPAGVAELAQATGQPEMIATLLLQRGLTDADAVDRFLAPKLSHMHDPNLLPNIAPAVERIVRAIKQGEKIVLFGDYDVDGITGTAMLWHLLRTAGAQVEYYIPNRLGEGYGMSEPAIQKLLDLGSQLIISIDNGGSAIEPIALARARGVDVIVTDHHDMGTTLPDTPWIVHPRLPGSQYPNPHLCGAGVAYKLCWALAVALSGAAKVQPQYRDLLVEFITLVALATIADVVPLEGENRVLAHFGLRQAAHVKLPGLRTLLEVNNLAGKALTAMNVGFTLGPRLNAASRMEHADMVVEMLTTATPQRAKEIATNLGTLNVQRQTVERQMFQVAKGEILKLTALPSVLVCCDKEHHPGVVGIVASRMVEMFGRPAFVLSHQDDYVVGSARSIPGFDLHAAIEHCRDLLLAGGGHAMAGGVRMAVAHLPEFRQRLATFGRDIMGPQKLQPTLAISQPLTLVAATMETIGQLAQFEPCGAANPVPLFLIKQAQLAFAPRRIGTSGQHLQLSLRQNGVNRPAVAFNMGALQPQLLAGLEIDLVVSAEINEYNGRREVKFMVQDIARSDGRAFTLAPEPT